MVVTRQRKDFDAYLGATAGVPFPVGVTPRQAGSACRAGSSVLKAAGACCALVEWRLGAEVRRLYLWRIDADYLPGASVLRERAERAVTSAEELLSAISKVVT